MPQIAIYLDAPTIELVKETARESGVTVSRWVADRILETLGTRWPPSVTALVGAWSEPAEPDSDQRINAMIAAVRARRDAFFGRWDGKAQERDT
jgi:hypothetical protein